MTLTGTHWTGVQNGCYQQEHEKERKTTFFGQRFQSKMGMYIGYVLGEDI